MKFHKPDLFSVVLIFIISLLFSFELFAFPGRPANFDSNYHISNIAQFSQILKIGEFPVIWMNNFANYGLPMGLFAHQATNYLGGIITLFTQNPTASYNLLVFLGVLLSNLFVFMFLRLYFTSWSSFLGTFIFCFSPYHIFNIYVRGAMPEVFSGIFLPLILIALYKFIVDKKIYALFLISIFIALLALTHPMMLVVYSIIFIPFLIFLIINAKLSNFYKIKRFITVSFFMALGLLMASYYIIPLNLEIKYFYYGLINNHMSGGGFLNFSNYFSSNWFYFTNSEIFPRGHVIHFGFVETAMLILGFIYFLYNRISKKDNKNAPILSFALLIAVLIIFFTTKYSDIFFQKVFFLNSIQFPWRFLSSLILVPSIIAAYLSDKFPNKIIFLFIIIAVSYFSFPQIYGKNVSIYPTSLYYFSKENAHSVLMNTIWTGKSEDYPSKFPQAEIIDGKGEILNQKISNSIRFYSVNAITPLKIVDRTFYFPGWVLYINNKKSNIEFQNPDFRGVITYIVPQGKHNITLVFEDTKIRLLGKTMSVVSIILLIILFVFRRKINRVLL